MNYIVFDLEWNQGNAETTLRQMPFEIVEIGAVKLNSQYEIVDTFQILVKPKVYTKLDDSIHRVVPIEMKEILEHGVSFLEAAQEFFRWCADDEYRFCTWGNMDLTELQRNLKHYQIKAPFPTPVYYYDIQKCFGLQFSDQKGMTALEDAVTKLGIHKSKMFHRAEEDARYTTEILRRLDKRIMKLNYSVDYYDNPKDKKAELYLKYPDYTQYVSREFVSKEKLMQDREVRSTRCPVCGRNARRKIRWYSVNSRGHYCLVVCQEHGYVVGKIRVKRTDWDSFFAEKFLYMADESQAEQIKLRKEAIAKKRREKKNSLLQKNMQ